jgi:hypothetical protein
MMGSRAGSKPLASIAAMPKKLRPMILALILAGAAAGVVGCGGGDTEPSIPSDDASVLASRIQEIQANVDNGSCLVAADRTDELIAEVQDLPSDVDPDVKQALENGANNLKLLLSDPNECERPTTTTETTTEETVTEEPTTTQEEPTTTRETPNTTTTPTQTQTTPTTPSGGVGPGSPGGL